jgi:hypothetical protein
MNDKKQLPVDAPPRIPLYLDGMIDQVVMQICDMTKVQKVHVLNHIRGRLHEVSPMQSEPVDFVRWVPASEVMANDYNPNSVAPPEMELLRTSISADGYTQPIVGNKEDGNVVVVDGFHRHRVGKECSEIQERVHGFLPVVQIRSTQVSREDRMASTIRHNRARGKHKVEAMSDMVIELKRRNWSNDKIAKNLGMDQDEILRLCQISGLAEVFSDGEFSRAWEAEGSITPDDFEDLRGDVDSLSDEEKDVRASNTNDPDRIFHTHDNWECVGAGFYETAPPKGMTAEGCKSAYRDFLSDLDRFAVALHGVTNGWKHSCEHYLTNSAMNRIAWLGQAAACYDMGIPAQFRGGYTYLRPDQQEAADRLAFEYLNRWMVANDRPQVSWLDACPDRQSDIY